MSDLEVSDVGASVRWLLVGFVVVTLLAIGVTAIFYQPERSERMCSRPEARCGE